MSACVVQNDIRVELLRGLSEIIRGKHLSQG